MIVMNFFSLPSNFGYFNLSLVCLYYSCNKHYSKLLISDSSGKNLHTSPVTSLLYSSIYYVGHKFFEHTADHPKFTPANIKYLQILETEKQPGCVSLKNAVQGLFFYLCVQACLVTKQFHQEKKKNADRLEEIGSGHSSHQFWGDQRTQNVRAWKKSKASSELKADLCLSQGGYARTRPL